jgi:DNA repair protein RecO (recombination protein O)
MGERLYRTTGIIIKRNDVGEADRVLTIITPTGKIVASARGVRKTASRLAGHLELLSNCQLQLASGRNRDVITQSVVVDRFDALQHSLITMAAGYYVAEMTDVMVGDEDAVAPVYHALRATLQMLCTPCEYDMVVHWYTLHLCDAVGYRPQLTACAACGVLLAPDAKHWSMTQGGMLCPECARRDAYPHEISLPLFKLLRYVQREPLSVVAHTVQSAPVHLQMFHLLRRWMHFVSERSLRAAAFYDDVRAKSADS